MMSSFTWCNSYSCIFNKCWVNSIPLKLSLKSHDFSMRDSWPLLCMGLRAIRGVAQVTQRNLPYKMPLFVLIAYVQTVDKKTVPLPLLRAEPTSSLHTLKKVLPLSMLECLFRSTNVFIALKRLRMTTYLLAWVVSDSYNCYMQFLIYCNLIDLKPGKLFLGTMWLNENTFRVKKVLRCLKTH